MSEADWLKKARSFISSAKLLSQNKNFTPADIGPSVGLLTWQGTENSLKAVCVGHNHPETHNLSLIINHIRSNNLMDKAELSDITRAAAIITGSATYNDTRYPEKDIDWWEGMPSYKLSEVVDASQIILDLCERKTQMR
jgi:hypothetical protein